MLFQTKTAGSSLSMREAEQELAKDSTICLLDVRTSEEYQQGHIPGSVNLPLDQLEGIVALAIDKKTRVFLYCLSGARSDRACTQLTRMGYLNVTNIGGVTSWAGAIEKGAAK